MAQTNAGRKDEKKAFYSNLHAPGPGRTVSLRSNCREHGINVRIRYSAFGIYYLIIYCLLGRGAGTGCAISTSLVRSHTISLLRSLFGVTLPRTQCRHIASHGMARWHSSVVRRRHNAPRLSDDMIMTN